MSDFNSSLPVRTELDGDVVVKIADSTTPSQQLTVNPDGSINVTDNGGSLTVDATDLDVRDLVFATDKVDVTGSEVSLDAATLAALEEITVQNGPGVDAVNIQDGGNSITVDAVDLDIRDLDANTDSVSAWIKDATGAAFSPSNPLPVTISDSIAGATEVLDFKQAASVASAASDTHTYTVTAGKSLKLAKVAASGSGKIKVEIFFGAVLKVVLFNSTSSPNVEYAFVSPQAHPAAATINVTVTNLDKQAQDLYSTIEGYEV